MYSYLFQMAMISFFIEMDEALGFNF